MDSDTVFVVTTLVAALAPMVFFLLVHPRGAFLSSRGQMARIVAAQEKSAAHAAGSGLHEAALERRARKATSARLTLRKKLRYAQWRMRPQMFRLMELGVSVLACASASMVFNAVITGACAAAGPLLMHWRLNRAMQKRCRCFEADYASFLLSLIGLLKTGMNVMTALDVAARALDEGSLVKHEISMMLERLRCGVPEEKAIGEFADDINHTEIELFVQALLLSRRVGGNLSQTLDRLARQVRKRQHFRESAVAAVSMQRASIWCLLGIMAAMEGYLYFMYPPAVVGSLRDPLGWEVWQVCILTILLGIYWLQQVTKIKA